MNSSSGGDLATTASAGLRTVPIAVKYPHVSPLLCIPNSPMSPATPVAAPLNTVKVLPSALQRATPIRVLTQGELPAQGRSLLNKQQPLVMNKNNQTIVIRAVPKPQPGGQMSLVDPKNLKYIGTFVKSKKTEGSDAPEQNVVIVTTPSTAVTSPYIVSKNAKPFVLTQLPSGQGKRLQVVLTTEGGMKGAPSVVRPSPPVSMAHMPLLEDFSQSKPTKLIVPFSQIPAGYKSTSSQVAFPGKVPVQQVRITEDPPKVSSISPNFTNFQITNGQIVSENRQNRMISILDDKYRGFELIQPSSPQPSKSLLLDGSEAKSFVELSDKPQTDQAPLPGLMAGLVPVSVSTMALDTSKPSGMSVLRNFVGGKRRKSSSEVVSRDVVSECPEAPAATEIKEIIEIKEDETVKESSPNDGEDELKDAKDESGGDEFDPIKCLSWSDNVGTLIGTSLKFRMNEFGLLEMVDEDSDQGKPCMSPTAADGEKVESSRRRKGKEARVSDEILCCLSCGTYGLGCEFISSRFCSTICCKLYEEEKAQSAKKQLEKQAKKLKLKQQKAMLVQQRANLEKLGLHEAKVAIEERIKMLRMERELMRTNGGDSEGEGDVCHPALRPSFVWARYLALLKAKGAPFTLFKEPMPVDRNHFKTAMKLEGIDPVHPSLFCVLTVVAVRGYRIKLHFDGYPDYHDFWVNANSSEIFHAGWCERTSHNLSAPKAYGEKPFNWGHYLRMTRTMAAPKTCFVNNQEKTIIPSGFRVGMKLEAVDKKNSSLVCVATIADVLDSRILVHFDSWDDIYDYWVDCSSPYIHPVGWCKENGHQLTPPNDFKSPSAFTWDFYLHETKSQAAPARAFKTRAPLDFRRGMRLECVDKRNPSLIRVATVVDVVAHQLKVKFDGWPDQYAYWVDDDSPDIHPPGWCVKTGHPLEPPPSEKDIKNTSVCPTPGCRGIGHVKGKHSVHHMVLSCPYSSMNYLREDHIPDRFCSKSEYYEVKDNSLSKGTKPRPGLPKKWRTEDRDASGKLKIETRGRKRKRPLLSDNEAEHAQKKKATPLRRANSGGREDAPAAGSSDPPAWSKTQWDVTEMVKTVGPEPLSWTPVQVSAFVENLMNCKEKARLFVEHHVDGEAFLMLCQTDLVKVLGFKLGPAVKLYNGITSLRRAVQCS